MRHVFGNLYVHYEWEDPALLHDGTPAAPGYYFSDETAWLHGPYPDSATACAALNEYAAAL